MHKGIQLQIDDLEMTVDYLTCEEIDIKAPEFYREQAERRDQFLRHLNLCSTQRFIYIHRGSLKDG